MIEAAIKRIVLRLFPELTAQYHLPKFGKVEAIREAPKTGNICDEYRPYYAVDVQIIDEHGQPDEQWPVLKDVPLSLPTAGHEMGQWAMPEAGTWVEIAFAFGSPNRPFIRCILPHGLGQPQVKRGEMRWQHNPASFQRADENGNWERMTDGIISDQSLDRFIDALKNTETYNNSKKSTFANDSEIIGAIKKIEAYGAMILLSGGRFDLGSLHDFNINCEAITTIISQGDINTSSQAKTNISSVDSINISSNSDINSSTPTKQTWKAPLTWMGSNTENIFGLVGEMMQLIIDLCAVLETHTHPSVGQINESGSVDNIKIQTASVKTRLDGITG